jgi:hypothetical protein
LIFTYVECPFVALLFFHEPTRLRYIYSRIGEGGDGFIRLFPFWIWECITYSILYHLFFFNTVFLLSYWYETSYWMKQLR